MAHNDRKTSRYERELHQRRVAREKYRALRKMIPKRLRERDIKKSRDLKYADEQGMKFLVPLATTAVSVMAGVLTAKLGSASDELTRMLKSVTKAFTSLKDVCVKLVTHLWVVPCMASAYWLFNQFSHLPMIGSALLSIFSTLFGRKIWKYASCFFSTVEEQSGLPEGIKGIEGLITTILCFLCLPKDGARLVPELMRRFSSYTRATEGVGNFLTTCMEIAENVINWIYSMAGKDAVNFGDTVTKAVKDWIRECEAVEKRLILDDIDGQIEMLLEAQGVLQDGICLRASVRDERLRLIMQRCLDRLEVRMRPYQGALTATKTFRVEPEMILLYGGSGKGKTTLVARLATSMLIAAEMVEAKHALKHLWQKGDTKYFESYFGQKCMIMDDVFQEKAKAGGDTNEFLQIIRMVGCWSYPLNMASVDLKAKFFFNSPLILGTTNASSMVATNIGEVIVEPKAVVRRMKCYRIDVAPEYAKGTGDDAILDFDKFEAELASRLELLLTNTKPFNDKLEVLEYFPWEAWVCTPWDWERGCKAGSPVSLIDLISKTALSLVERQERHLKATKGLHAFNQVLESAPPIDFARKLDMWEPVFLGEIEEQSDTPMFDGGFKFWFNQRCLDFATWCVETDEFIWNISLEDIVRRKGDARQKFVESIQKALRSNEWRWHQGKLLIRYRETEFEVPLDDLTKMQDFMRRMGLKCHPDKRGVGLSEDERATIHKLYVDIQSCKAEYEQAYIDATSYEGHMGKVRWYAKKWGLTFLRIFQACAITAAICVAINTSIWFTTSAIKLIVGTVRALLRGIVAAVKGIVDMIAGLFRSKKDDKPVDVTDNQSNVKEHSHPHGQVRKLYKRKADAQSGFDGTQHSDKHNKIYNNTYKIVVGDGAAVLGQIVFIEGHLAVMPQHFVRELRDLIDQGFSPETKLRFLNAGFDGMRVELTIAKLLAQPMYAYTTADLVFIQFDERFIQAQKKITNQFMSEDMIAKVVITSQPVRLDVCDLVQSKDGLRTTRTVLHAPTAIHVPEIMIAGTKRDDMIGYRMCTEKGMCGAPLMVSDPTYFGGRCMLGFHVAGNSSISNRWGYTCPISSEMVDSAKKYFGTISDEFEEDCANRGVDLIEPPLEVKEALEQAGLIGGSITLSYEVAKPVHLSPNTKLKISDFGERELFGPSYQRPAHLRPVVIDGTMKYPMVEGIRNYQTPFEYRIIPNMSAVVDLATYKFRQASMYDNCRSIFTFEEAVMGYEGLKIKAINRHTSAGFPYIYDVKNGKTEFFGKEDFEFGSAKCVKLKERVEYVLEKAKQGVRLSHICVDFLKDELRPDEKVDACQTRIISGSPLDYVLACRMMFGAFIAACFKHHTETGLCPGINPYSDWYRLANHIRFGKRSKCFDGDFKRFDASEQPYVHWEILNFINRWYDDGEDNARIRRVLWLDLVHSRHLTGLHGNVRYVTQWNKSLPSGHPLTTIVNSFYSLITLTACYISTTGDFTHMWERVALATFGDDNLTGVDDDVADVFNQVTVASEMDQLFGLTYTSGAKDGKLTPYKSLEECTFLKRGFYLDAENEPTGWNAPLAFGSFLFTSYYYKNELNKVQELVTKLEGSLGEMSLHPPEVWRDFAPPIFAAMADLGHVPILQSRQAWREELASRVDFWF